LAALSLDLPCGVPPRLVTFILAKVLNRVRCRVCVVLCLRDRWSDALVVAECQLVGTNGFCRDCLAGSILVAAGGSALSGTDLRWGLATDRGPAGREGM
jgi:hypothetical protein